MLLVSLWAKIWKKVEFRKLHFEATPFKNLGEAPGESILGTMSLNQIKSLICKKLQKCKIFVIFALNELYHIEFIQLYIGIFYSKYLKFWAVLFIRIIFQSFTKKSLKLVLLPIDYEIFMTLLMLLLPSFQILH